MVEQGGFKGENSLGETARKVTEPATDLATGPLLSRDFLVLAISAAFFCAGIGASNALLPVYVVDDLGGSEAVAGFVMGSLAISSLLSRGWVGRLGARRGARALIIIGCILGLVGMVALVFATTSTIVIGSRLVTGVAQAAVSVGATVLAGEFAPEARRGEAASYVLVCFHLGLAVGPPTGEAIQSATTYQVAWIAFAALWGIGGVVATRLPRAEVLDVPKPAWIHRAGLIPQG